MSRTPYEIAIDIRALIKEYEQAGGQLKWSDGRHRQESETGSYKASYDTKPWKVEVTLPDGRVVEGKQVTITFEKKEGNQ